MSQKVYPSGALLRVSHRITEVRCLYGFSPFSTFPRGVTASYRRKGGSRDRIQGHLADNLITAHEQSRPGSRTKITRLPRHAAKYVTVAQNLRNSVDDVETCESGLALPKLLPANSSAENEDHCAGSAMHVGFLQPSTLKFGARRAKGGL
jgi:hypothetical protein